MLKQFSNSELAVLIGERITIYRKNLSLSQADLAKQAGLSLSTMQKLESGKANISLSNLLSVLRYLGLLENLNLLLPEQPLNPYKF